MGELKKILFAVSASAVILLSSLAAGCSENEDMDSENIPTSEAVTTAEETSEEPTTEEPVQPKRTYEECRLDSECVQLKCLPERLDFEYMLRTITPMGGGIVALNMHNIESEPQFESLILLVDVIEDKIVAEKEFSEDVAVYTNTSKGLALRMTDERKFCYYNEMLEKTDEFDFRNSSGIFSEDGESFFFVADELLYRLDIESGSIVKVSSDDNIKLTVDITQHSARNGYINVQVKCPHDGLDAVESLINCESGELLMLNRRAGNMTSGMNGILMRSWYSILDKNCVYYLNKSGECYCYDSPDDDPYSDIIALIDDSDVIYYNDGSSYYFGNFSEDGKISWAQLNAFEGMELINGLPDENLVFVAADTLYDNLFYVIDPEHLYYYEEVNCEQVDDIIIFDDKLYEIAAAQSVEIPQVGEYLSAERERADKLEEKYGVTIYMSNQCEAFLDENGMDFDKKCSLTNIEFDEEEEKQHINETLDALETAMKKYPEGFLRQFRNPIDSEGIEIHLVGTITDDLFGAAAYAHNEGDDKYYMTMDVCQDNELNFPHELWHNTESLICNYAPKLLDDEVWMTFNPKDFEYSGYEEYGEISYDFTYEDFENNKDWYFYDTYSKTNFFEDKARIMEHAMTDSEYDREFFDSENIQKKLRCISNAIRGVFDTTGWKNVKWERYLTD